MGKPSTLHLEDGGSVNEEEQSSVWHSSTNTQRRAHTRRRTGGRRSHNVIRPMVLLQTETACVCARARAGQRYGLLFHHV